MASLNIKTMEKIRDDFLRTYRSELIRRGIPNPNVSYGTEIYIKATALAQQIAIAMQNTLLKGDALMPDTAQDGDLERYASFYGLELKPATGSVGQIILNTTIADNIPILVSAGQTLQDPAGQTYQVTVTGNYKQDGYVEVASIDTGASTNLAAGTTLRWVTLPAFAQPTCVAGIPFTGGADNETIESLRVRVLQKLANPPGGGNWSQVAETAENASPSVQKAFVYPACNGPATCGVVVVSSPTDTYKGRNFGGDLTVVGTEVIPNVLGNFPEFIEFVGSSNPVSWLPVSAPINVSLGLSLPAAKTAAIPGNGSGWLDGNPFPVPVISGGSYVTGYCDVVSVTDSTHFTVNADATSLPANTSTVVNISWLSSRDWILRQGQATVSGGSSPYSVSLTASSEPFLDTTGNTIQPGDFVFPTALNTETYVAAYLEQMANLGPGQKVDPTVVSGLFPRAYRRPLVQDSWASDVGPSIIKFLQETGTEVQDVQYLYRQDVGNGAGMCPVPASVQNGPYILIPHQIGFYPNL